MAFAVGVTLNTGFVIAEVIYGLLSHSLALLADAGHNLSDVLGLLLAWGASVLARRLPSSRFTYGLRSTSILAAVINAVLLLTVTGGIAWEAIGRFGKPDAVQSMTVIVIAAIGVVINTATALMFMRGGDDDLNIRGAFLHMAGDAVISLGVVIAGVVILYTGWVWLDPAASLVIALLIVAGTWGLLRDSLHLALQAVPQGLPVEKRPHLPAGIAWRDGHSRPAHLGLEHHGVRADSAPGLRAARSPVLPAARSSRRVAQTLRHWPCHGADGTWSGGGMVPAAAGGRRLSDDI